MESVEFGPQQKKPFDLSLNLPKGSIDTWNWTDTLRRKHWFADRLATTLLGIYRGVCLYNMAEQDSDPRHQDQIFWP